jgi:hypothetical protein
MKIIYKLIFTVIGSLLFTSCNDDYLQETPMSFLAPENTFVNTKGFETALTGLYIQVQQEWGWSGGNGLTYMHFYVGTDICISGNATPFYTVFESYGDDIHPTNGQLTGHWNFYYGNLGNINLIIEAAEDSNVKWDLPEDKNRVIAEAKFFRAYWYRALMSFFGEVPLVTKLEKPFRLDYTKQSASEILDFMIEDLKFSSENLPALVEKDGKIVKAAALHMLAEAYLWAGKPELAEPALQAIINSGDYQLMKERFGQKSNEPGDVYADLFIENNQNRGSGNLETIWAVQQEYGVIGGGGQADGQNDWSRRGWVPNYAAVPGMIIADSLGGRGIGRLRPMQWWLDSYDEQDIRASIYNIKKEYWYNDPTSPDFGQKVEISEEWENTGRLYPSITKFNFGKADDDPNFLSNLKDRVKIRLAETYLLLAEAQMLQGKHSEAAASINMVRARANASPVAPGQVDMDYILDERARELLGEEHRRFTLVRTGTLIDRVRRLNPKSKDGIRDYHVRWPIPQTAIDANSGAVLEQNPGY